MSSIRVNRLIASEPQISCSRTVRYGTSDLAFCRGLGVLPNSSAYGERSGGGTTWGERASGGDSGFGGCGSLLPQSTRPEE